MTRDYGSGSLEERKPGVWRIRAYAGRDPVTNAPRQVTRTVHGGKRDAQRALTTLLEETKKKSVIGTQAPFSRLAEDYLRLIERGGKAKSTLQLYRQWLDKRILPAIGDMPINKIDTHTLDGFFGQLTDSGLAPSTVTTIKGITRAILEQGVNWGWLASNPTKGTAKLKVAETDRAVLSEADVMAIIHSAEADDSDLAAMIAFAAWIGARRGELCGLRWSDVGWSDEMLTIERAWVPGVGGQHLTTTKTGKARTIPIPQAVEVLRLQMARKTEVFGDVPADGYIFGPDDGTTPPRAKSVTEFFSKHARKAGVSARFHDLRHFAVTRAINEGWNIATSSRYFGHTEQVMLSIYSHGSVEDARRSAAALPQFGSDRFTMQDHD